LCFPALQALIRAGHLEMPIIGVARTGCTLGELRDRARDSVAQNGGVNAEAFAKLSAYLQYVSDYQEADHTVTARMSRSVILAPMRPKCCVPYGFLWNTLMLVPSHCAPNPTRATSCSMGRARLTARLSATTAI
jgi:glucose-6-phosphate 1-dehydrogenase